MTTVLLDALEALRGVARWLIVVMVLFGLWLALRRAGLDGRARTLTWLGVAVPLLAWLIVVQRLAQAGAFLARPGVRVPAIPLAIVIPVLVGLVLLTRSGRMAAVMDALPPSWLVGLQVYRVFGAVFLVRWAGGQLPAAFALPAGIGDVLVGLLALPVALYLRSGAPGGWATAYAWNLLGIIDLVVAVTLGALTAPGRLQMLALDQPNTQVGTYPLVMIPAFAVPLSLILHGLSLWQLKRSTRRTVAAS